MSNAGARKFQKGDILFNENDPITTLLFIQAGKVKYFLPRGKGIEFQIMSGPFVIGESALYNQTKYPFSAVALTEISAFEFNLDSTKQTLESSPQFFKTLIKSLVDNIRNLTGDLKSLKLEQSPLPCPPELITRLFGGVFHTIKHTGKPMPDGRIEIDWSVMKKYTHRIFNLSNDKVEAVNNLMAKFGHVEFKFEKDEEDPTAPEQLTKLYYAQYELLEVFFEFYQYYFYKSGKQEILKYEEPIFNIVRGLIALSQNFSPDRQGVVRIPLSEVLEFIKKEYSMTITASHWQILDTKGLFSKRAPLGDGSFIMSFHLDDFQRTYNAWRFLREIAKWNDTGSINPKEPEFPALNQAKGGAAAADASCPECNAPINSAQKFCGECGAKLGQKSA